MVVPDRHSSGLELDSGRAHGEPAGEFGRGDRGGCDQTGSGSTRSVEQELVYRAKLREVRRAIECLPSKQRAAVLMHKYEEMEYSQIANVLSCSESAVKSLLFRAYEHLRSRLAHMA